MTDKTHSMNNLRCGVITSGEETAQLSRTEVTMVLTNETEFPELQDHYVVYEELGRAVMFQLLQAVQFLHSKNIVHRDLKLENILLDDDINVKVSDFGLAKALTNGQLSGALGTLVYMAPEVVTAMYNPNAKYGKEVDLLYGDYPFHHRRQGKLTQMIRSGINSADPLKWEGISESAKDLILKLLVLDPKARLTAEEAIKHPFFEESAATAVLFLVRLKRQSSRAPPPGEEEGVREFPHRLW
ncbi:phosphorylase b kinase gamma catalytic chain, liver/testis isoform-like [Babylonia areolata]|uniref:phosphorylase b kinase gamma catalytic chain, liver/testis isoform-like n=1 Tax=Babylonia areolata TaxID=304850 RepID=UPI003FD21F61